jgi:hypothetical protein
MDPLALTPCPACEKPVSVRASACPNCGYKKPISEKLVHIVNNSETISRIIKVVLEGGKRLPSLERVIYVLLLPIGWPLILLNKWSERDKIKQIFARETWNFKKAYTFAILCIYFLFSCAWMLATTLSYLLALLFAAAWLLGKIFGVN